MTVPSRSPFTWKGVGLGAALAFFIGVSAPYAVIMLQGSFMAINSSSPGAVFLFLFIVLVLNVGVGLIRRRFALSRADLILVYFMMLLAVAVPTQAFVGTLIPVTAGLHYYASPENNWAEQIVPFVVSWVTPQDFFAVKYLHEGLPSGQPIPWEAWITPLTAWYVFFLVLSFMMICMGVILHRQWSQHERLAYPMVQLPLQMIESEGENRVPALFKSVVMWVGFAVPLIVFSSEALHFHFPIVPSLPAALSTGFTLFRDTVNVGLSMSYAWIGFFYLVSLEITFSIWFFYLFCKIEEGIFNVLGIASTEKLSFYAYSQTADLTHQSMGACIAFVLFGLWMGRRHLLDVVRTAWAPTHGVDDSEEVLPYRVAVIGFTVSLAFIGLWLWQSGFPMRTIPIFLVTCIILYIMVARVVAAAGVATARAPLIAAYFLISGFGTSFVGAKGLIAMSWTYIWQAEMRLFPLVVLANGLKLAESVVGPKRRLFWAAMLALVCSLVGSTWIILTICYEHGGINLHRFFMTSQAIRVFNDITHPLQNPTGPDLRGWLFTGIGGGVEALLMWTQHRFHWWPLHPIGFVIGVGWLTGQIWFSVMVAWLLKLLILRYGGIRLYNGLKPFFLGMILGECTTSGLWLLIDMATGTVGNHLTST
ncbi:MAG: DUF6785 family protein [Candidatus Latescibacterota bacterium]|nr:DUF6785 family protein [Candidatus Latescibacterota bacterium]